MTDPDPTKAAEGRIAALAPVRPRPAWMNAALREAAACRARLPWERGARRRAFCARRARDADPAFPWRQAS